MSVSHDFMTPTMFFINPKNLVKNEAFHQNHQKINKKLIFFVAKSHNFVKKTPYDLKNHTQRTSGGTLKICRRNLKTKNQFLLIFDDFGEKLHF